MAENSKTRTTRPGEVPDGARRVRVVYDATKTHRPGTVVDVHEDAARILVRENRAAYVDASTPLGHPDDAAGEPDKAPAADKPAAPAGK